MSYTILRIAQSLILPPSGLLILMAVGFLIVEKRRILGFLCIASGFFLLYALCLGPVSDALIRPLENMYPPLTDTGNIHARAIVVLSGGVRDPSLPGLEPEPADASLERLVQGVVLYRKLRIPLVFVGGSGDPARPELKEADAMAHTALGLGVPARFIHVENSARNTLESARALKRLLESSRVILVTSAYHMKRAVAFFKKQGLDVVPAPTDYRAERRTLTGYSFIPRLDNLYASSAALSEYLSYRWYGMRGDL
jgi:uncharacterized SAM-binding protein YcdF (DUF218 family)